MNVASNIEAVRTRIRAAAVAAGRDPDDITLLAVAKGQPVAAVQAAWSAGQRAFGENYLQDAADRVAALPDAEWHFIGRLQANKTREISGRYRWVHTIDRARIAARLDAQRGADQPPLNVCIQVNLDGDPAKGGVDADGAVALATQVAAAERLRLRGLMAMPREQSDFDAQRAAFARVRLLFESLRSRGFALDTLSMGMTLDLEAAIAEGATIVRVGTAIFGPRR